MKNVLEKLFGSLTRTRLIQLFILNPETIFDGPTAAKKIKSNSRTVLKELLMFAKIGLVKKVVRKKDQPGGYMLNSTFSFLKPLQDMFGGAEYEVRRDLANKLPRAGKVKMVILTGSFMGPQEHAEVDILIVGDGLNKRLIGKAIEVAESKLGRELSFAMLGTEDFQYRSQMFDRFLRRVLESPHEMLIDKLER